MGVMVQIRDVPEELHGMLKARAAANGVSLSEYLVAEVKRVIETSTWEELSARLKTRSRVEISISPAEIIRQEREERAAHLEKVLRDRD